MRLYVGALVVAVERLVAKNNYLTRTISADRLDITTNLLTSTQWVKP